MKRYFIIKSYFKSTTYQQSMIIRHSKHSLKHLKATPIVDHRIEERNSLLLFTKSIKLEKFKILSKLEATKTIRFSEEILNKI